MSKLSKRFRIVSVIEVEAYSREVEDFVKFDLPSLLTRNICRPFNLSSTVEAMAAPRKKKAARPKRKG